jgi:Uma2 family endonuclease
MQLLVDQFEKFSGAVLHPASGPLTDAQFLALSEQYPDCRVETTADGDILIMPPAHPRTGQRNAAITHQLFGWAEKDGRGEAFDSSAGFFLNNGARRSPDSAWVSHERLRGLNDDSAMWHVTPEFVIELKSASDRLETLRAKMREWAANGVELGWLINPESCTVEVYRRDGSAQVLTKPSAVEGDGPVEGFVLNAERIWQGIRG